MTNTSNYGLNIVEGNDIVNPLTQFNPNFETIDEEMKRNADNSISMATELKTGTVHTLVRTNKDASVFRFVATSDYNTGDTFTVDGVQVTALMTTGQPLADKCYVVNSNVLCILTGTLLTVYAQGGATLAEDSEKLGGNPAEYYATSEQFEDVKNIATSAGEIATQANETANEALNKFYMRTIWTNPNPDNTFAGKTITPSGFNRDNYSFIIIRFRFSTSATIYVTNVLMPSGYPQPTYALSDLISGSGLPKIHVRNSNVRQNSFEFDDCYAARTDQTGSDTTNGFLIPTHIYGVVLK